MWLGNGRGHSPGPAGAQSHLLCAFQTRVPVWGPGGWGVEGVRVPVAQIRRSICTCS